MNKQAQKGKLTLGEGHTPIVEVENIFLKCEYENPTGSWKDRGMVHQIKRLLDDGVKEAVISSSGNAAISAASYCRVAGVKLTVFVSPKINKAKLDRLVQLVEPSCIIKTDKPLSASIQYSRKTNAANLRQSKDPYAFAGYETIAYELSDEIPKIDAVFLPVSGGTATLGMANGFLKLGRLPPIHAVQTEAVHPIASFFDKTFQEKNESLADAIVAKFTPLEDKIIKIIKKSHGWGWVIADDKMKEARDWLLSHNMNCSYEGAAAVAALWKAKSCGYNYKNPVCVLSGKYYPV